MLEIAGLHHRYPKAAEPTLTALDLSARRGEILGLLGPNGAGKSTLVAHLAGLIAVQQGSILIDGQSLAAVRHRDPTRIAVAPQEYAFYPMLTVAENLACFAAACRLRGHKAKRASAAAVATTRLESFTGTRAERLSGGLKRRLNLAIALLARPDLIVLDEPTVGVDPQSRAFLLESVKALAAGGMAVIYTSHYMDEIESIADRVTILDRGRVRCSGTLAALLGEGDATLEVVLAAALSESAAAALAPFKPLHIDGTRLSLALAPGHTPAAALACIESFGCTIREIRFGCRTLEQRFMALTDTHLRDH